MAIICHCEVVKDRTIVKAVRHGACTMAEVQAACGAATRCGACEFAVADLIERHAPNASLAGLAWSDR
jgi:bacterioferritin-associated ferredoxin